MFKLSLFLGNRSCNGSYCHKHHSLSGFLECDFPSKFCDNQTKCIQVHQFCDGEFNCDDKSDEGGQCGKLKSLVHALLCKNEVYRKQLSINYFFLF